MMSHTCAGACPGIRKGGGGPKSESLFFSAFQFLEGGLGPPPPPGHASDVT